MPSFKNGLRGGIVEQGGLGFKVLCWLHPYILTDGMKDAMGLRDSHLRTSFPFLSREILHYWVETKSIV